MTHPHADLDATAQAELIRSGTVSPVELTYAALDALDEIEGLNAVIHRRDERARAEAAQVKVGEQPFAGVPIVVKDLDGYLAGEPYHAGSKHLREAGYVAERSSLLFERLQAAGFVIVGKTNTPELGLVPTTEPTAYGPTRNPWDTDRSPGGSSGGSAAAVASGAVAVGHAGDGGGSIRIPASFCGLVGLKPSRARVSMGPDEVDPWAGLVARLAVTRTVRDTAAILEAVAGGGPGDTMMAPPRRRPWTEEVGADPGRLRIAVSTSAGDGGTTAPEVVAAIEATAAVLAELGHHVEAASGLPSDDPEFVVDMSTQLLVAMPVWVARALDDFATRTGSAPTEESVEPITWALATMGRATDAATFAATLDRLGLISRRIASWWDGPFDLLLTPTVPEVAPTLGQFDSTPENPAAGLARAAGIVPYTIPFNISGQPAISVPAPPTPEGLPVGAQLVAAWGREDLLIQVASQLEIAQPWVGLHPRVWVG